jgi:hypothetical protein
VYLGVIVKLRCYLATEFTVITNHSLGSVPRSYQNRLASISPSILHANPGPFQLIQVYIITELGLISGSPSATWSKRGLEVSSVV